MELVIMGLQLFSFLKDPIISEHVRVDSICANTFKKYMIQVVKIVEDKIVKRLPKKFSLVLDG